MPGYSPKEQCECRHEGSHERGYPYRSSEKQLFDVRLSNAECAERCCFGLSEEDKDGIEFVLVGNEEKDCDRKRDEELSDASWY